MRTLVSVAALVVPMTCLQGQALAADPYYNCMPPHCFADAVAQNTYYGAYDTFTDASINMPTSEIGDLGHLNNELWLYTNYGQTQWVEAGSGRHCTKYSLTGTCSSAGGLDRYIQFWADFDSSGNEHFHLLNAYTSHDGKQHTFQIDDLADYPNADYDVSLDGNVVGTSTDQLNNFGTTINVGMELYSPPGINFNEYTDSFVNSAYVFATSGTSFRKADLDTGTVHNRSDPSCLTTNSCTLDPCSEFSGQPCLYWSLTSPNQWTVKKPASN
jgi:hypothetical protein